VGPLGVLGAPFEGTIGGSGLPELTISTGQITGAVFDDVNADGTLDPSESGIFGQIIYLDLKNDSQRDPGDPIVLSGKNGFFQFTNLPAGNYTVRQLITAPGLVQLSAGGPISVSVQNDSVTANVNFGDVYSESTADGAFVDALYGTLLHRTPDAGGLTGWTQLLGQGTSREQIARNIWASPEHRGLQIDGYYQAFLRRQADADGKNLWLNTFAGGASEIDVQAGFLQSAEYRTSHSDNSSFLAGLYGDILGRAADNAGLADWGRALQGGMSRGQVAKSFLTSGEADVLALDNYYQNFLHRSGDSTGFASWLGALKNGRTSLDLVAQTFLSSDEFYAFSRRYGDASVRGSS
jgi:hypothetical protein